MANTPKHADGPKPVGNPKNTPRQCGYCGEWYENWDAIMAHVEVCPKADSPDIREIVLN